MTRKEKEDRTDITRHFNILLLISALLLLQGLCHLQQRRVKVLLRFGKIIVKGVITTLQHLLFVKHRSGAQVIAGCVRIRHVDIVIQKMQGAEFGIANSALAVQRVKQGTP